MYPLRSEIQTFMSATEHLLSLNMQMDLTQDERDLVLYYLKDASQVLSSVERGGISFTDEAYRLVPR